MVLDLLAKLYLFVFLSDITIIGPTKMITGTANVLSNLQLVIDVAFGNFCRLSFCFTHCLTYNNGFINIENNFVSFYFQTK